MKEKTLVFLKPFRLKNPTEQQTERFNEIELLKLTECSYLGKIYTHDALPADNLDEFIRHEAESQGAKILICEDECATAALNIRGYMRYLINPRVSEDDIKDVSEDDKVEVYGFFKDAYQHDYVRFQEIYPHAAWFENNNEINLFHIHDWIKPLIEGEEW